MTNRPLRYHAIFVGLACWSVEAGVAWACEDAGGEDRALGEGERGGGAEE